MIMTSTSASEGDNQSVVVILDASRDDSLRGIGGVLQDFSLKSRDNLTILAVLQQVNSPSTFPFSGALKRLGYRVSVDSGSMLRANRKIVEEVRASKELEFDNKPEIKDIRKHCYAEEIGFEVIVLAGKGAALEKAREAQATWVVLDKEMKKEKKYFLDRLSCGVSRMKRDNSIEDLRGPKETGNNKHTTESNTKLLSESSTRDHIRYEEMIPGSPKGKHSQQKGKEQGGDGSMEPSYHNDKKNTEQSTKMTSSSASQQTTLTNKENNRNIEGEKAEEQSSYPELGPNEAYKAGSPPDGHIQHPNDDDWMGGFETDEELVSTCSKCENKRPKIGWTKEFTYSELQTATKGFSKTNFLSEGGFGSVFRGQLKNGLKIAVKQHKNASSQGEKEFKAEVHFLSKARHKNLVMLLGSCSEGSNRLLVYEYVCNGSLDQQLSKYARKPLTWDERMKIATGAAKGLEYLHENNIVHRDIRPNNILLTHDYDTLLGDFGLARTQHEDHSSETRVVGTLGYLAPEYAESGKVSTKTDVYAFGVILLQLITGRGTNDKSLEGKSLVGWARPLLKDRNYPDLIDSRILESHDVHQLFWMVRVAEKCLSKDPRKRLTMDKVVNALNHIRESDTICNITFSPAHSDSAPSSSQGSPETNAEDDVDDDDDDNDHAFYVIEPKARYSMDDYDHMTGRLSQSSSTQSTSSGRSSLSPVSELSTLDSGHD